MKQLLYIPSGSYFKFFPETDIKNTGGMCWSIEDFLKYSNTREQHGISSYEDIINEIVSTRNFSYTLYENAEIDPSKELTKLEFELVEVDK